VSSCKHHSLAEHLLISISVRIWSGTQQQLAAVAPMPASEAAATREFACFVALCHGTAGRRGRLRYH